MKNILILLASSALFFACSTTSSVELIGNNNQGQSYKLTDIKVENKTGEVFEDNIEEMMKTALQNELKVFAGSNTQSENSLEILITQYSKGNAFGRWLAPGVAKTILTVEASVKDDSGEIVMQSQVTRSVGAGGGFTIGAWKKVFEDVALQLVKDMSLVK